VYEPFTVELPPGGLVVVYSDGISEAANPAGARFGAARVRGHLGAAGATPRQIGQNIIDDVRQFLEDRPQEDDMCLVCFGREPAPGEWPASLVSGERSNGVDAA
jgi:phosphoserine phosphatase RsbU/P